MTIEFDSVFIGVGPPRAVGLRITEIFADGDGNLPAGDFQGHLAAGIAAVAVGVLGLGAAGQFEVLDVGGSAVPQARAPTRIDLDAPNADCPGDAAVSCVVGIGP
ncbi:hypothetical protein Xlen_17570 [Xanthomonas campestris pv. leeana]|nr:hypothetical protein Xths_13645 [Xanthomonas campestris pv. thespesiae]OOW77380.1 hypothetical protein Xlen_17570 [Xanthomonas campestris pv. leeana]